MTNFVYTPITAYKLTRVPLDDHQYIALSSGFKEKVLLVFEDAFGELSVVKITKEEFENRFDLKIPRL